MTDTALPKSSPLRARKLYVTNKHGNRVRIEDKSLCDICPYGDNKTCKLCVFNADNIRGVMAAFTPKQAYRRTHQDDLSNSPLLQGFKNHLAMDNGVMLEQVLPNPNELITGLRLPMFPIAGSYLSMVKTYERATLIRKKLGLDVRQPST